MQTESECGSGTFDWKATEHTFNLINHYLGSGCEEYTFWNAILCDEDKLPVMVFLTPDNKFLVVAGNFNDTPRQLTVQIGNKYLDVILQGHSFNTFSMK